jgi:hypothetical protein
MRLSEIHNPFSSRRRLIPPSYHLMMMRPSSREGLGRRCLGLVHSIAVAAAHMSYASATRIQRRERTVGMSCGRCPYYLRTELGGICRVQGIKNESPRHKHHRGDERNRQLRHISLAMYCQIASGLFDLVHARLCERPAPSRCLRMAPVRNANSLSGVFV